MLILLSGGRAQGLERAARFLQKENSNYQAAAIVDYPEMKLRRMLDDIKTVEPELEAAEIESRLNKALDAELLRLLRLGLEQDVMLLTGQYGSGPVALDFYERLFVDAAGLFARKAAAVSDRFYMVYAAYPLLLKKRKELTLNLRIMRHGMTTSNSRSLYIGHKDEALAPEGLEEALAKAATDDFKDYNPDFIFTSGMLRTVQTVTAVLTGDAEAASAENLRPPFTIIDIPEVKERDFGSFEGYSHNQLKERPEYIKFVETVGEYTPDDVESKEHFARRIDAGGSRLAEFFARKADRFEEKQEISAILLIHGGSIMEIFSQLIANKGIWGLKSFEEKPGSACLISSEIIPESSYYDYMFVNLQHIDISFKIISA